MSMQEEYFRIGRVNNSNYPLLTVMENGIYEKNKTLVESPETMEYALGAPIPQKPIMVDFHKTPYSVVSQKIHDVLEQMNIKGIQLIPATIEGKNKELFEKYWFINIYNKIPALDRDNSKYKWDDFLEIANPIKELVLDENKLSTIPLEERLIFRLEENTIFEIYHKSVVEAIMAVNPEGVQFTPVAKWSIGSAFE